jgi:hypothetical protein
MKKRTLFFLMMFTISFNNYAQYDEYQEPYVEDVQEENLFPEEYYDTPEGYLEEEMAFEAGEDFHYPPATNTPLEFLDEEQAQEAFQDFQVDEYPNDVYNDQPELIEGQ